MKESMWYKGTRYFTWHAIIVSFMMGGIFAFALVYVYLVLVNG